MLKEEYYKSAGWKHVRSIKQNQQPICQNCMCFGREERGTELHHILKFMEQPEDCINDLFLDQENLVCLCKKCHRSLHGKQTELHPRFLQFIFDTKNYLCWKYLQAGKNILWTNDKNRRKLR